VFEPHWQVLMAAGRSSGSITWGGERFDFVDAPSYAEKNWGAGFPEKWIWVQCNAFEGRPDVALTATGARRALPFSATKESVGLVGLHWGGGRFLDIAPTNGELAWSADPWGRWHIEASTADGAFRALVEASASGEGTLLRAPTDEGLQVVCRDTFQGDVRLRVWERGQLVLDVESRLAGLEVGGGPWLGPWEAEARMEEPYRSLSMAPLDAEALLPACLRPPGL